MTATQAVDDYIKQRTKNLEAGLIIKGRLTTIKTHLGHWLKYIGKDVTLKGNGTHRLRKLFPQSYEKQKETACG